jgi:hypothetical protein
MRLDFCVKHFDFFLYSHQTNADDLLLLIADGHVARTRNMEVIERVRQNNITILFLPSHSAHRLYLWMYK